MQKPSEILSKALFTCSSPDLHNCPSDEGAEVAFAGRSNAGKSSAINCICDQAKLARTSKTPGRTQQINFFELDTEYRLVDLPGYGYAKVPEKVKIEWQKNMQDYFENRSSLKGIILVMDVRHPLKPFDEMMLEWANHYQMPIHILLTKADKLKSGASKQSLQKVRSQICEKYPEGAFSLQLFSALKQTNVEAARKQIMTFLISD